MTELVFWIVALLIMMSPFIWLSVILNRRPKTTQIIYIVERKRRLIQTGQDAKILPFKPRKK